MVIQRYVLGISNRRGAISGFPPTNSNPWIQIQSQISSRNLAMSLSKSISKQSCRPNPFLWLRTLVPVPQRSRGRVTLKGSKDPMMYLTAYQVFMTRRDQLTCLHEPFGDAFYFGPERLSPRYEDDVKTREESGFSNATFQTIFDHIERRESEV